jgi:hypothetical protein
MNWTAEAETAEENLVWQTARRSLQTLWNQPVRGPHAANLDSTELEYTVPLR